MRPWLEPMVWSIAAPLIGACLAFVVRRGRNAVRLVTVATTLLAALGVVAAVHGGGARVVWLGDWAPPLGIALRADGLSAFMIGITGAVGLAVSVYAMAYLPVQRESDRDVEAFWPLWFFAWLGLNGIYLSGDLFNLFVSLEVLGLSTVGLVALAGGEALTAGIRYAFVTLFGSTLFLLGVALLYSEHGIVDMALLAERVTQGPAAWAALVFMTAGMALKTALVPLHFWLPSAHASALGPVSALLSALVVKGSFYLVVRLWIAVFPTIVTTAVAGAMGLLAAVAVVWGSVQAARQARLKRLVAYSTVAQVGYLFLVLPLGMHDAAGTSAWSGVLILVATHACAKGSMFLAAGTLQHAWGDDAIANLSGLVTRAPVTVAAFALAGVALVGLPPTGGFMGKWMLLSAAFATGHIASAVIVVLGTLLSAAYVLKPLGRMLLGPPSQVLAAQERPIPRAMTVTTMLLAVASVLLGLSSQPPTALLHIGRPFAAAMDTEVSAEDVGGREHVR